MKELRLTLENYTSDYIKTLIEAGFVENLWNCNMPLDPRHEEIRAIKVWHDAEKNRGVACVVEHVVDFSNRRGKTTFDNFVEFYTYKGQRDSHDRIRDIPDYSKYIQEMVDKGVIEFEEPSRKGNA